MLWPVNLLKLGMPGITGFLLGLVAIAVIAPETAGGKVLLLGTTTCAVVLLLFLLGRIVSLARRALGSNRGQSSSG